MSIYQIGILGTPTAELRADLCSTLGDMVSAFGLRLESDVAVLDPTAILSHSPKAALAAVWFGGPTHDTASVAAAEMLVRENLPIIPVVAELKDFIPHVPAFLHFA